MTALRGLSGVNPRDFLAALGLLRVAAAEGEIVRLCFQNDAGFTPEIQGLDAGAIVEVVLRDVTREAGDRPWRLCYEKQEKKGAKLVADLKAPPERFKVFLREAIQRWIDRDPESAKYAAAYGTDSARDGKGNTKPTAFHFTAANQQFLETVEQIRSSIDADWCAKALFDGHAERRGPNLRWDPGADRAYALMAEDPNAAGTSVNAPIEWLAFRALPLFPVIPVGRRAVTTSVRSRSDETIFHWPLWATPASLPTVRSLLSSHARGSRAIVDPDEMVAVCSSEIRRTSQGFGNFGPARIETYARTALPRL